MNKIHLVIIAGGSGTRFWPKSTSRRPKQLLSFDGNESNSLLVQTLSRFDGVVQDHMIITTELLKDAIGEQSGAHAGPGKVTILAEPQGRNTAPCVYWGARAIAEENPGDIMLVMPADHYIPGKERFIETVRRAIDWARTHDDLVTLGVKPSRPETGYGYLRIGTALENGPCRKVEAFVEKPNFQKAREFLAAGNYLWNGGMFVWRAEVILKAFDEAMPEMKRAWDAAKGDVAKAYPAMTATSIDYGVMEKAKNVVSFPLDCGWDDLGSWTSLEGVADVLQARKEGGVVTGGELLAVESHGNIVDAPGKLVAILGVNDLIVVESGEAILVANKSQAQDIKKIVDRLKTVRPDLV